MPKVHHVQHVKGLDELESASLKHLKETIRARMSEGDDSQPAIEADFGMLLSALLPEHLVQETSDSWEEDALLTEVASQVLGKATAQAPVTG